MNYILFDGETRNQLLPLTYTRPIGELLVGALRIREKWARWLGSELSYITQDYLGEKYPLMIGEDNTIINGAVLPNEQLVRLIQQLGNNEALLHKGDLVAARMDRLQFERMMNDEEVEQLEGRPIGETPFVKMEHLWSFCQHNGSALAEDFALLSQGRPSQPLDPSNRLIGDPALLFIEEGASVVGSTLNTSGGPIYIGRQAEVMEGCLIRGPLALGEGAVLKMGAKIYGATSIGPHCKVGGELNNCVINAYSNKAHDGFLGHSVLGEWCNLGADTNNSNLKNTYAPVRLWNYPAEDFAPTGQTFCGLFMADHAKAGINTMFNTGTVVGVAANVFGSGYPEKFVPSFSWGNSGHWELFRIDKAYEMAEAMMQRRGQSLGEQDRAILAHVFKADAPFRRLIFSVK